MSVWDFTIYKSSRQAFFISWILEERSQDDWTKQTIRRKHAAEKLGYRKVPVIIRVLSEDDSILSIHKATERIIEEQKEQSEDS